MASPFISVVVTSRNDNHGDRLLSRMQTFLNCFLDQCRRHELPAELVIVEWNPPNGQPSLREALNWTCVNAWCPVRFIHVPEEVHRRFRYSEELPLFQMIAKNVGIRRAGAPFVLATNIDILFSEELVAYLASRPLRDRVVYRVDRYDVPSNLPPGAPVQQLLDFCRENAIRVYTRRGTMDAKSGQYDEGSVTWKTHIHDACLWLSGKAGEKRLHTNASGDFTLLSKEHWFRIRGYPELEMLAMHVDGLGCQIAFFAGAREHVLVRPMQIYHIEHSADPGWTPEGDGALTAGRKSVRIPQMDYEQYRNLAIRMRMERRPIISNTESWGLSDERLPETAISR